MKKTLLFLFLLFLLPELDAGPVSRYNVVWNSPSKNASGTIAYSGAYPFTFRGCNSPSIKV